MCSRGPKVGYYRSVDGEKHCRQSETCGCRSALEIFNAFNNVNYGQPNAIFGSATFGRISATSTTYPNMRQMQLGLKLIF